MKSSVLREMKKEEFNDFFKILESSFPAKEYRSYERQKELLDHPHYDIEVYEEEERIKGYISS